MKLLQDAKEELQRINSEISELHNKEVGLKMEINGIVDSINKLKVRKTSMEIVVKELEK